MTTSTSMLDHHKTNYEYLAKFFNIQDEEIRSESDFCKPNSEIIKMI
jgi:hypothetical protein